MSIERARSRRSKRLWLASASLATATAVALFAHFAIRSDSSSKADEQTSTNGEEVERLRVRVINRYPHQRDAFTQGLVWNDGILYESTGHLGRSSVRKIELATGKVLQRQNNDQSYFAEGLALVDDHLVQLTWRNQRALVLRLDDFTTVREHAYKGEGWGLCYDGRQLVMSDGTDALTFRDPITFAVRDIIDVTLDGVPVSELNELECVEGSIWANIWKSEQIVRIEPKSGRVTAVVDASGLLAADERRGVDVLNGIAWMPETGHFLITGKYWPWLFEVDFIPMAQPPNPR